MIWVLIAFAIGYIGFIYWYVNKHPELIQKDDDNDPPFFIG